MQNHNFLWNCTTWSQRIHLDPTILSKVTNLWYSEKIKHHAVTVQAGAFCLDKHFTATIQIWELHPMLHTSIAWENFSPTSVTQVGWGLDPKARVTQGLLGIEYEQNDAFAVMLLTAPFLSHEPVFMMSLLSWNLSSSFHKMNVFLK
jgi:hypothetical protein